MFKVKKQSGSSKITQERVGIWQDSTAIAAPFKDSQFVTKTTLSCQLNKKEIDREAALSVFSSQYSAVQRAIL